MILDFTERQRMTFNCTALLESLFRKKNRHRIEKKLEKELDIVEIIRH